MEPEGTTLYYILAIFGCIFLSGFFSMSESAIISLSDSRLKRLAEEGNKPAKKILKMIKVPSAFLATIQIGITVCGFLASALAAKCFAIPAFLQLSQQNLLQESHYYALLFAVTIILLAFFMSLFGKLFPKRLASYHAEEIALSCISLLSLFATLLKPMVWLLSWSSDLLLRLVRINPDEEPEQVTEEEIRMLVDVGEEKGVIEQSEKVMINNIFEFDDRDVSEIMTHRTTVAAVEKTATYEEVIAMSLETGYSRLPVYEDSMDNIVGMVHIKDLFRYKGEKKQFSVERYMRPALFVPESISCTELLRVFKIQKKQLAIVIDEYGGTYGIVTMEDLLEAIVGDIQDEYDNEEAEMEQMEDGSFTFDGAISIEDAQQALGVELLNSEEYDDYDTLGAVLIDNLGHIPKEDEEAIVILSGVVFQVVEADDRRIIKIRAEYAQSTDTTEE